MRGDYLNRLKSSRDSFKNFYGFDVETYDHNKKFLWGSVINEKEYKGFSNKFEMVDFIKNNGNAMYCATNLGFDSLALFGDFDLNLSGFKPLFRNSEMISGSFEKAKFLDTMNFWHVGVAKLGEFLNIPKLEKPSFLGLKPKNEQEWEYLKKYNKWDSWITYCFIKYLRETAKSLGGSLKLTIASTSMSIFRAKYLRRSLKKTSVNDFDWIRRGYFGGRTENFMRGLLPDHEYFFGDFNSLYPSVMKDCDYPDPNYTRFKLKGKLRYITDFEGMTEVEIEAPDSYYPLLPYRNKDKLIFPSNCLIKGVYSHVEIRKALELGYRIKKIHSAYVSYNSFNPFHDFIKDLYSKRLQFKKDKNPMELFVKLCMNNLYGKMGQDIEQKEVKNLDDTDLKTLDLKNSEILHNWVIIKKRLTNDQTPSFTIPMIAAYVTSHARIKLYDELVKRKGIYCDTDSIITKQKIQDSSEIGELKNEGIIETGILIKPKMYMINDVVKIKGYHHATKNEFLSVLNGKEISFLKFAKFKESLRSTKGRYFNEPYSLVKKFDLEDNKREWNKKFSAFELQDSRPLQI